MKRVFGLFIIVTVSLVVSCGAKQEEDIVERGKYLVTFGGCHDCHSPKVEGPGGIPLPDEKRLLSGHPENAPHPVWTHEGSKGYDTFATANSMFTAWAGPWGVSFAANLTPDTETGIAEWSEQTFIQTLRTGKHGGSPNGRDILPPMPWFNLKDLSDNDFKAIWAYLRSIPPVKNQVPFPIPPGQIDHVK